MKHLVIAEKSSAGKDIAKVLGLKDSDLKDGYMENDEYIVGWARGHLVGQKQPYEILGKEMKECWDLSLLPFHIDQNRDLKVLNEKGSYAIFKTLKELINRSDVDYIINAGDAAREGELIQQWIYKMAGNKKPIKRLWCSSLTENGIKQAFNNLKPNEDYLGYYEEGKALKIIDWQYGMTYTVALTKLYGTGKAIHYGRCQIPLLNLIVNRDLEIENFKPETYYTIEAAFDKGYSGTLINSDNNETITYRDISEAEKTLIAMSRKSGTICDIKEEDKEQKAPKLFSLIKLQQHIGKLYGYSPDKTLSIAQSLYEKKYTTYPRTDSEYLSEDIWQIKDRFINSAVKVINSPDILKAINYNTNMSKEYVDNNKVTDHHAIIPTENEAVLSSLSEEEKNVYIEICKRLLSLFLPTYKYKSKTIYTKVDNKYIFITKGKDVKDLGYKKLFEKEETEENETDEENNVLPALSINDQISVKAGAVKENVTKPKPRYNVGNITDLMEKYSIGRPSTMGEIVNKCINTGVIELISKGKKKEYKATDFGKNIIKIIPEELKSTDLCHRVEERIADVRKGKIILTELQEEVYKEQEQMLKTLNNSSNISSFKTSMDNVEIIGKCPICGADMIETQKAYSHKDYKNTVCKYTIWKETCFTKINLKQVKELLEKGQTIGNYKSKDGKPYKRIIYYNKDTSRFEMGEYVK
ncbi:MAG: hypothetical protein IJ790_03085 [Lachnospiraceae bacterium]|nr:hypothetical protein [Lachnospiraceae bacterium]